MRRPAAIAAILLGALAFLAALTGIWDADLFHHLAVGRALARGTDFSTDPFLHSRAGEPSGVPPYALGSFLLHLASVPAGPAGAVALAGLLGAALVLVLLADALDGRRDGISVAVAAAVLLLVLPELRFRSAPRPEAFANVLLAGTMLAIRRAEGGRPRLLLLFPVAALAWGNLHPSVAMGLGAVGLLVLARAGAAAISRARGGPVGPRDVRAPAAVLAAALVAVALTPSSRSAVETALRYLASWLDLGGARADAGTGEVIAAMRAYVSELQPPSLLDWVTAPFGILVVASAASSALARGRGWGRELATVLAFGAFAAGSIRFAAMAAYVAAPIAARNVAAGIERLRARRPALAPGAAALAAAACVAAALAAPALGAQAFGFGLVPGAYPVRAAEYLRAIGFRGRLYNEMGAGGYLQWTLDLPVFQDGRGFARPQDFRDVMPEPVDPARMARLDARFGFDALVVRTETPPGVAEALLEKVHGGRDALADRRVWALVAFDDGGALYLRRDAYPARAAADEYATVAPGAPIPEQRLGEPGFAAALRAELERAVREAPGCVRCRLDLATLLIATHAAADAARVVGPLRAVRAPHLRPAVEAVLATEARARGDVAAAERHYRAAIRLAGDATLLRRALATLLLAQGRDGDARELVEENLASAREGADLELAAALARRRGDGEGASALDREARAAFRREWARDRLEVGLALVREGRARDGLAAVREAVEADPGYAPARAELDRLLREAGLAP